MTLQCIATQSQAPSSQQAAEEIAGQLAANAAREKVRGGFVYCSVDVDVPGLVEALGRALPGIPFVGATSCVGVGSARGFTRGPAAVSALWLAGDDVHFSVAALEAGSDSAEQGRELAERAAAGLGGKTPRFAILHSTPGGEEALVRGIHAVLPKEAILLGGSAADDDLSGKWLAFASGGFVSGSGAALAVCNWPGRLATGYQAGASITQLEGTVTRAEGRVIYEIDGKPAAEVYDRWIDGKLSRALESGGSVLGDTTLTPLGVFRGRQGEAGSFVMIHPERVLHPSKALTTFAEVHEGEHVVLMRSSRAGLVGRSAGLAERALAETKLAPSEVRGALLVYCAGSMLTIQEQTSDMLAGLRAVTGGAPCVSGFFYGEQGCAVPGRADHGNLMTGVLLFGT